MGWDRGGDCTGRLTGYYFVSKVFLGGGETGGSTRLVDGCNLVHGEEFGDDGDFFANVGVGFVDEGLDNGAEIGVGADPGDYKGIVKANYN